MPPDTAPTALSAARPVHRARRVRARVGRRDRWFSGVVGSWPPSPADPVLAGLTRSADHGLLWLAVGALLAAGTRHTRRGAVRALLSVPATSVLANTVAKPLVPRRRPAAELLPASRALDDRPTSSSFPSGHAASAAAFVVAVGLDSPRTGLALAPLAGAVAYSRVHVGVHWGSDVLAGVALGATVAVGTQRWLPRRPIDEAAARPVAGAPALTGGAGLTVVVNAGAGSGHAEPARRVAEALPAARVRTRGDGEDLTTALREVAARPGTRALGIAGGDGSVAAAARVAAEAGLPLAVIPSGTLNHFGRDVGVYDLQEVVDATGAGEAVAVDLGRLALSGPDGTGDERGAFVNTASFGGYPEMVRRREALQHRGWSRWPAATVALLAALYGARPLRCRVDGEAVAVWMLFVGNGPYVPAGTVPSYRPRLDSGRVEVRYLRADRRFSRVRAVAGLVLGTLRRSRTYREWSAPAVDVELLDEAVDVAADGEVVARATRLRADVGPRPVVVYRRDERFWPHRG